MMSRPYRVYSAISFIFILGVCHSLAIAQDSVNETEKKWTHSAAVGMSFDSDSKIKGLLSWQTAYWWQPEFSTGIEAGYFFMDSDSPDLLPIFAVAGFKLSQKKGWPIISGGLGHNFTIGKIDAPEWGTNQEISGSWSAKLGLSIPIELNNRNQLAIGLTYYRFNYFINYHQNTWWGNRVEYEEAHQKSRIAVSFGLTF